MMRLLLALGLLALPLALLAGEPKFDAAARARALAPLIEDETIALVRIDAPRVDVAGLLKTLTSLVPARKTELTELGGEVKGLREMFVRAGGTELVVAFSTRDLPGPSLVWAPLKEGADVPALTKLLQETLGSRGKVEKQGNALVAGSPAALARLAKGRSSARAELLPAVTAAGDTAVQVLLLPTDDARRVLDEVLTLPALGGSGKALTRGARWAALGLNVGARPTFALTLQAADAAAARKVSDLAETGLVALGKTIFPGEKKPLRELLPKDLATATKALRPQVIGDRVTVRLSDPAVLGAVAAIAAAFEERMSGVDRSPDATRLRQILIALHGYHDATGTFPAQAISSKAGRPLLSWRVAILPYIEQGQLYNQFKLDEPWDSPHNKALIPQMPKTYRSSRIKDRRVGLTTFLAPVNKAFVFTGEKKGLKFTDIPDGTSNTVMVVDVADEAGAIWTKPDDLVVDEKAAWKGLIGHYPNEVMVGMADASVHRVAKTLPGNVLWALFTRAGGEVISKLSR